MLNLMADNFRHALETALVDPSFFQKLSKPPGTNVDFLFGNNILNQVFVHYLIFLKLGL